MRPSITALLISALIGSGAMQCSFNSNETSEENKQEETVRVVKEGDFNIYYPSFSRIDLVTGQMPSKSEKDVIFVCEAAFTGTKMDEFSHKNINGHHVCNGVYYEGSGSRVNNGVFTWSKADGWQFFNFSHKNSVKPLKDAAEKGGMGFCQSLLFFNGKEFTGCFKAGSINQYRALCDIDGELCIVDCAKKITFADFKKGLKKLGAGTALYCDMGTGWNYSWYRKPDGSVEEIFTIPGMYTTNWLTFYK